MNIAQLAKQYGVDAVLLEQYLDEIRESYRLYEEDHGRWLNAKELKAFLRSYRSHAHALRKLLGKAPAHLQHQVDLQHGRDFVVKELFDLLESVGVSLQQVDIMDRNRDWHRNRLVVELAQAWKLLTKTPANTSTNTA
jgi:hypothetical protein